jgi:hypothetical protein
MSLYVWILVEGEEAAVWTEALEDGPAVAAATKSYIYIRAVGVDGESVKTFAKHHRQVVGLVGH